MVKQKPELLAPVGNIESFYAALNAGADAVYLGLQEFNARGRASNFTRQLLQLAVLKAREKNVKIYVTLNVLIKNRELDQLIDALAFLDAVKVNGVIIQDWGTYYIARKYFPRLVLHASTQMGNHNSVGVNYGASKGIVRTVLARELTMPELEAISLQSKAELEVFIHGALCYSFSGMCLFSSYSGGQGANRGICKQSCRRIYQDGGEQHALFSLKDNQQIENLQKLMQLGIRSLKIEGRMKSADYVYQVCKAYRMAIDDQNNIGIAAQMLELDMGREKTSWFLGGNVSDGITDDPSIGIHIGQITDVSRKTISFTSSEKLAEGYRIRVRNANDDEQLYLKIENFSQNGNVYQVSADLFGKITKGDDVLLVRVKTQSFSSRLGNVNSLPELKKIPLKKQEIRKGLQIEGGKQQKPMLLVRIGSPAWLPKLRFDDYDAVILSYKRSDWEKFDPNSTVHQQNRQKIRIELPKFISEKHLDFYRKLAVKLVASGFNHFFISQLSQKMLLPSGAKVSCNENVYVLNDASARMLDEEKIAEFTYPLENDVDNLLSMSNKQGIVPLYFYPELFYSRMPVKINQESNLFADETNKKFRISVKDGITIVHPSIPVALFHYRKQLEKNGFNRFLIDYSGEPMTANVVKRILKKFLDSEAVQPSTNFNFKLGLK
ncbi:protease [Aquipluma nitroreducens]|uniref:Protease n=1 Tax=Aquipluma nitroreducens TaxID=2010828 RepID=A0A5K7SFP7_9BACT|nr:peptidase U32 family protein [Aquipluma nitroreducens]BBE20373.1 protease [Aquipluma nitroreducens]